MKSEQLNVAYGSHPLQGFDVYFPDEHSMKTPVVFLIHGGGFIMGRKEDFIVPAKLFRDEGFVVVNLSHRLIDANWFSKSGAAKKGGLKIGDQLADVEAAMQHYKRHAAQWGAGTERLFVAGHSAGAILALLYMMSDSGYGAHGIRAAGNWAGVTDLTLPMDTMGAFLAPWQKAQVQSMYDRMLDYTALTGGTGDAKAISPYWVAQKRGSQPVISLYPEHNVVLQFPGESALGLMQTKRFHALLRERGIDEQFSLYKGCDHSFRGPAGAWNKAVHETAEFFRRH